jgi:hypothetical protein
MREPHRWGISVSRSGYFQVSVIRLSGRRNCRRSGVQKHQVQRASGEARLSSMEDWIDLLVTGDGADG